MDPNHDRAELPSVGHETRDLPVELTQSERVEYGRQLAQLGYDLHQLKEQHKAAKKKMKAAEDDAQERINELGAIVRTGAEKRRTRCVVRADFAREQAYIVREDTGQQVGTRPLTQDERQLQMPLRGVDTVRDPETGEAMHATASEVAWADEVDKAFDDDDTGPIVAGEDLIMMEHGVAPAGLPYGPPMDDDGTGPEPTEQADIVMVTLQAAAAAGRRVLIASPYYVAEDLDAQSVSRDIDDDVQSIITNGAPVTQLCPAESYRAYVDAIQAAIRAGNERGAGLRLWIDENDEGAPDEAVTH